MKTSALHRKMKPGMASGSRIGCYDGICFAHARAGSIHEPRTSCITVGLDDGTQSLRVLGEATVGSPKQVALVQADTRGKNVSVAKSKPALWSESPARY